MKWRVTILWIWLIWNKSRIQNMLLQLKMWNSSKRIQTLIKPQLTQQFPLSPNHLNSSDSLSLSSPRLIFLSHPAVMASPPSPTPRLQFDQAFMLQAFIWTAENIFNFISQKNINWSIYVCMAFVAMFCFEIMLSWGFWIYFFSMNWD